MSLNFRILKKALILSACIVLGLFFTPKTVHAAGEFITTWKTDNAGTSADNQITIPTTGAGYNFDVDWGDASSTLGVTTTITHSFPAPGTYTVTISGTFPRIYFHGEGDRQKILSIEQWGTGQWDYFYAAFKGCSNLVINAVDAPDLSHVTDLSEMFNGASSINSDLSGWDMSHVTNISAMFYLATSFNGDITNWDVSNVTNMGSTFGGATSFDQDIGGWDTSNVTSLYATFDGASIFNQDIGDWDVHNVTSMSFTFRNATLFNQDISGWDVSQVTSMASMFNSDTSFNQDIGGWDVSQVTDMSTMFYGTPFNQALNLWDVHNVTNMSSMFGATPFFNKNIDDWDVSNVTTMSYMFYSAPSFNQPLDDWDVSSVTDLHDMFFNATSFNQDISDWDVSHVTTLSTMFENATSFNQPLNSWNVSSVGDMSFLFYNAISFNQPLDSWDVSQVVSMGGMFAQDSAFNQPLNDWDVSNVQTMNSMFRSATSFNQPLNNWDVSQVTGMGFMFNNASAFDQDISSWDVSQVNNFFVFLAGVTLSTSNYDAMLRSWSQLPLQNAVNFSGGGSVYCASPQRAVLTGTYGWTVADGGVGVCHTLTYSSDVRGSISGFATQGVQDAATGLAVTAVPHSGYYFKSWSDGSTANPRTDANVTGDISVIAQFKRRSFGSGGGSIILKKPTVSSTPSVIFPLPYKVSPSPVVVHSAPVVVSTPCSANIYPTQSIRVGAHNDVSQVKLLQQYLNTYEQAHLVVDGIYKKDDQQAVIAWQEKYASDVLAPWGIVHGTGYIYTTSLQKFKTLFLSHCQEDAHSVASPPEAHFTRDLKFGMVGNDVRVLQKLLGVKNTGYFGPQTQSALIQYQKSHNIIPASGYFGPRTRAVLK